MDNKELFRKYQIDKAMDLINNNDSWILITESDTMARYEEIMADASRRKAAMSMAKKRADELTKRANAMNRVAKTRSK